MAALGRQFTEAKNKGNDKKTLLKFNSQNPNGIKRELNQIQGNWRRLKLQSKKEDDLQSREARKSSGGKALSDVEQERSKCHEKGQKRRIVRSTVIFERLPKRNFLLVCVKFSRNDMESSFCLAIALETL